MLTVSEIDWLKRRSMAPSLYYCGWCMKYAFCCTPQFNRCPIKNSDWQDALEFSERVAVKLAADENCGVDEDCPPDMPFGWGRLKAARLSVEEEMDGTD